MDTKKIKELIRIVEDSKLENLEIKENDFEIKMSKSSKLLNIAANEVASEPVVMTNQQQDTINSPLIGTFYSKPAPDLQAFVKINQTINVGDVVCIIEAMKVMNEIKADKAGIIKEILVRDEMIVEYGQPLFVIE